MRMRSEGFVGIILVATSLTATAQHPFYLRPLTSTCEGQSETVLSGIDIIRTTMKRVIEKLGQPTRSTVSDGEGGPTRTYERDAETWWIRIVILKETDFGNGFVNGILSIDIGGVGPDGEIGTSGDGLELGSTVADARRIYGCRFRYPSEGPHVMPRLFENRSYGVVGGEWSVMLELDFDEARIVTHMRLTNPCPSPCW